MVKGVSYKHATDFNRREMVEVEDLSEKIFWAIDLRSDFPDFFSVEDVEEETVGYPSYVYNGVKIMRRGDKFYVYHTYTTPYMRVLDRYFLKLMLKDIESKVIINKGI